MECMILKWNVFMCLEMIDGNGVGSILVFRLEMKMDDPMCFQYIAVD